MSTTSANASSSAGDGTSHRKGHRRQESMYAMTGLYSETTPTDGDASCDETVVSQPPVKCHSRNPSASLVAERSRAAGHVETDVILLSTDTKDCGILSCRPAFLQKFSGIKVSCINYFIY